MRRSAWRTNSLDGRRRGLARAGKTSKKLTELSRAATERPSQGPCRPWVGWRRFAGRERPPPPLCRHFRWQPRRWASPGITSLLVRESALDGRSVTLIELMASPKSLKASFIGRHSTDILEGHRQALPSSGPLSPPLGAYSARGSRLLWAHGPRELVSARVAI